MLKSMTGYGGAREKTDAFTVSVEVRCVNNKFLKVTSRIPEEISFLQNELESPVREFLQRGSVYITVQFEPKSHADFYEIDEILLKKYYSTTRRLCAELGAPEQICVQDLLPLPGVITTEPNADVSQTQVLPVVLTALRAALKQVVEMRRREGEEIDKEFRRRSENLKLLAEGVKRAYPEALKLHHKRLEDRVNLLLKETEVQLAELDLVREVAIIAERADISEELSRMDSHIAQFLHALDDGEPVGRKLEFIVQEMFRECNTMGSKSADSLLNQSVVDMKAEVTRLKEQVLNVE